MEQHINIGLSSDSIKLYLRTPELLIEDMYEFETEDAFFDKLNELLKADVNSDIKYFYLAYDDTFDLSKWQTLLDKISNLPLLGDRVLKFNFESKIDFIGAKMNGLFLNFNLFDAKQKLSIISQNEVIASYDVPTEELASKIADLCASGDIIDLYVSGERDYLLKTVVPAIDEALDQKYSNRKIEVHFK